jgi:hypothetical protein
MSDPAHLLGILCPGCGSGRLRVLYTRPKPGSTLRAKQCRQCGRKVLTAEQVVGGGAVIPSTCVTDLRKSVSILLRAIDASLILDSQNPLLPRK